MYRVLMQADLSAHDISLKYVGDNAQFSTKNNYDLIENWWLQTLLGIIYYLDALLFVNIPSGLGSSPHPGVFQNPHSAGCAREGIVTV